MDLISFAHKGWRFKYINFSRKFNLHKLGRFKGSLHLIPDDADSSQVQRRHGCIYGVKFMYKFGDKVHIFIQPSPQLCVYTETRFTHSFNLLLSSVYLRRQGLNIYSTFSLALCIYGDKVHVNIHPSSQLCLHTETRFKYSFNLLTSSV